MLSYSDLQKGITFLLDGEPYQVVESQFLRMQQRKPVMQAKIKNLVSGKVMSKNFHQNESFKEVEIERTPMIFLFEHRDQFTFHVSDNPADRKTLDRIHVGGAAKFLKPNLQVEFQKFSVQGGPASNENDTVIGISLPIKIDYIVKEAPPTERGNTAQGGTKEITLENGLRIQVPFFIREGDVVRINTETSEYVERAEKQK
ncbi:hypothetical protein IIA95_00420 [Patescibacteria group bacterium]|nr:hypothetical protein [Patescibacteria group bacterium]